jgi:hypothetical protein
MSAFRGEKSSPPSPEWLAAYVDGEFEGSEELAGHKRSIEDWLEQHPESGADIVAWRRLKQLCQKASPDEPDEAVWNELWLKVEQNFRHANVAARARVRIWIRGIVAAMLLLTCSVAAWSAWQYLQRNSAEPESQWAAREQEKPSKEVADTEDFPVATAEEVTILHVEGDDTGTLVVGSLPLDGPLELLEPGEIYLNSVEPAPGDDMVPNVTLSQGSPLIWAPIKRER